MFNRAPISAFLPRATIGVWEEPLEDGMEKETLAALVNVDLTMKLQSAMAICLVSGMIEAGVATNAQAAGILVVAAHTLKKALADMLEPADGNAPKYLEEIVNRAREPLLATALMFKARSDGLAN